MSRVLLHVESLCVSFDGFKALDIEFFELFENELRVIIGPNGAGKTTFMDVLCGKTRPSGGMALLDGKDLTTLSEQKIVEEGVGRKFQTPSVFGGLRVLDNFRLARKSGRGIFNSLFERLGPKEREEIEKVAETVGLHRELDKEAAFLSHGQKQWLEIGMLILQDPRLLLIDEPAAGMTDEETAKTAELLLDLSRRHSVIVIEHDMEFVKRLARKVTVLCEGKVLTEGSIEKVQNDPLVIERYLGRAKAGQELSAAGEDRALDARGSGSQERPLEAPVPESRGPALEARNLSVYYGESRVLRDLHLRLRPGRITALMGRNGVGKTTLLKALAGILPARRGEIALHGEKVNGLAPEKRARRGLAYVPQGREIFPRLTIEENLFMGLEARADGLRQIPEEEIYGLFPVLAQMRKRLGGNLSGGQQQQLAIARALVGNPSILLLDEPTEGIQPSIIQDIETVLLGLRARGDMTILLVEQYLDFARRLADDFYLMERGAMVLDGEMPELTEEQIKEHLAF